MRLGIFGGTFDPVHYGHLLLAESCREQLRLDQVWFLPAAVPPHKQECTLAPAVARAEMLELAIGGHPAFVVCRHEIEQGGVNFTADTLARIKAKDPTRELFFLMGADSLRDLPGWRNPQQICEFATPVMVRRGELGEAAHVGESFDWSRLETILTAERVRDIRDHQVHMPRVDLSSSEIRARVAAGESIRFRTPRAVEKYIESHRLYAQSA
jgi:nicotinate-nucleotide adenylyltransferase